MEVIKRDHVGNVAEATVLAHSKDREDTYSVMGKTNAKHIAHFYLGELPKNYAVAFLWH